MELGPILSAMRRNKVGALVIVMQTALTLAILCNSLFLIQQRLRLSNRPTGTQEESIFTVANQWVGNPPDLKARQEADLAVLRSIPGVADAFASNSYPLSNGGWDDGISLEPDDQHWTTTGALYFSDEHGLATLLLAKRAPRASYEVDVDSMVSLSCAALMAGLAAGPSAVAAMSTSQA